MTKREAEEYTWMIDRMRALGIARDDCEKLRRISMTLRRWFELECGDGNGCIERDETTGKAYWLNSYSGTRSPMSQDREVGARKRLAAIMAKYPGLVAYVQGDPRGCALYLLTPAQIGEHDVDSVYTRGLAVA